MTEAFDPRLLQVGIEINGVVNYYNEDLFITVQGTKYGNENPNECQVRIDNLTRQHRDSILTATSLFNKQRPITRMIVRAGRKSYGYSQIFLGSVMTSGITQPPDIGIILNAVTYGSERLETIAVSMPGQTSLSAISQTASKDMGLSLSFQANDKKIANYSFTGTREQHVAKISQTGLVDAYVDDSTLVVKNQNAALPGQVKNLSMHSGMVGIPELTENGIRVKFMYDNTTKIGTLINLKSELNPSLNGKWVVYNLHFDLASRDTPFYLIAECARALEQ